MVDGTNSYTDGNDADSGSTLADDVYDFGKRTFEQVDESTRSVESFGDKFIALGSAAWTLAKADLRAMDESAKLAQNVENRSVTGTISSVGKTGYRGVKAKQATKNYQAKQQEAEETIEDIIGLSRGEFSSSTIPDFSLQDISELFD